MPQQCTSLVSVVTILVFCSDERKCPPFNVTGEIALAAVWHVDWGVLADPMSVVDGERYEPCCRGAFRASEGGRGRKKGSARGFIPGVAASHLANPSHMICEATGDRCIPNLIASIPFSCRQAQKNNLALIE